ncbi:MAG: uroporphyrinogen-III synthase [Nevskiales bacterium]|nr:uroporphyrinogen-III synthase [Nevskiales bacterium]
MTGLAATLAGLHVLVTRPADQAESMCRLLLAHGAEVSRLPIQAIEAVRQPQQAARRLQQGRDALTWIFTSVNAVRFARQLDQGVWPGDCIAVGKATAAALAQLGVTAVAPDDAQTSEGVLRLPLLDDVSGRRILLVTGEGGRQLMQSTLAARGARVERVEVYRRVDLPHDAEAVANAVAAADVALLTNGESLRRLAELMPSARRPALLDLQLVVPSRRVVEQAARLGFKRSPLVPEQVSDTAYLKCLERWYAGT